MNPVKLTLDSSVDQKCRQAVHICLSSLVLLNLVLNPFLIMATINIYNVWFIASLIKKQRIGDEINGSWS